MGLLLRDLLARSRSAIVPFAGWSWVRTAGAGTVGPESGYRNGKRSGWTTELQTEYAEWSSSVRWTRIRNIETLPATCSPRLPSDAARSPVTLACIEHHAL